MPRNSDNLRRWPEAVAGEDVALERTWPTWKSSVPSVRAAYVEPSLEDLLCDPVAHAMMQADGVVAEDIIALLERLRARILASPDDRDADEAPK